MFIIGCGAVCAVLCIYEYVKVELNIRRTNRECLKLKADFIAKYGDRL